MGGKVEISVNSFYIANTPVTQKLWETVMVQNPSFFKGDSKPVENINKYDAMKFCNKLSLLEGLSQCYFKIQKQNGVLSGNIGTDREMNICDFKANGYRLPTVKEWEFAARGGNKSFKYQYSGSNEINRVAWFNENSNGSTKSVGTKQPNELKIFDMSGNVWEWCWDIYYGSATVLRGGSWNDSEEHCKVDYRYSLGPFSKGYGIGFRLARRM